MMYVLRWLGSIWPIYREARCGCIIRIHFARHTFDPSNCTLQAHLP